MKKNKYRAIFLIIFLWLFSLTSVNNTEAFLDWDLWLNLYKELDEWLIDFEEKQFVYELSGQDKKNISENVNKILKNSNIWDCLKEWLNESKIAEIASWNIEELTKNLKEECYNSKTKTYNSKKIANIIWKISEIKSYYQNQTESKAEHIHEISRIWMYSDWTTKNSPFDVIKDLQDIDKIIFTEETEYNWEESDFLSKYKNDPFVSPTWNTINNIIDNSNSEGVKNNTPSINDIDSWLIDNPNNVTSENNDSVNHLDWNVYMCPVDNDESWLSDTSLNALLDSLKWNNWWFTFNYWSWGHIALPSTNKIKIPDLASENYYRNALLISWKTPYNNVNDNDSWKCNQFFCIIIEFVVNKQNALDYSDSHSIENILETSNKHLKKAANTSLVQSKMTTNNFEMSLRDLNLPDMFHMWFIITKKAPPILHLEELNKFQSEQPKVEEETKKEDNDKIKILLRKKYANFKLNYDKANNLNNFKYTSDQLVWIVHSLENPSKRAGNLNNENKNIIELQKQINKYSEDNVTNKINNSILKDFWTEFTELEQFNKNMLDYSNNIDILIKNLKDIKTYSW